MTKSGLPLKALAGFRSAGRLGSFQAAARALGLTPSAISHQVAQIESYIGAPVFVRGTRTVGLTPLGRKALAAADRLFSAMETLKAAAGARQRLTVSALPFFTQAWLMPRIARFSAAHPDIEVSISTENKVADLSAGEADIGIRNLRQKPPGLFARKLIDIRGVPVCSPALKAGPKPMATAEDLTRHRLIQISSRPGAWDSWFAAQGLAGIALPKILTVDTVPAALEAAAQGAGVALGMDPLLWQADVARKLTVAVALPPVPDSAYYVCTTRANARRGDVQAFLSWLAAEMARRDGDGRPDPRHAISRHRTVLEPAS
jgi:LysR family glycine cleavage system transcriptional activator